MLFGLAGRIKPGAAYGYGLFRPIPVTLFDIRNDDGKLWKQTPVLFRSPRCPRDGTARGTVHRADVGRSGMERRENLNNN